MGKRLLLVTHNIGEEYLHQLNEILPEWKVVAGKEEELWTAHAKNAEVIVGWKKELQKHVLHNESKLRWIQSWSAGVNSMPLNALDEKGVLLTSANGVHAYPISETIFAMMLGLTRKIHTYVRQQQTKEWHHAHMNMEIHEKTIGIIGVGEIGQETAKIAKAFRMNVLGVRHSGVSHEYVDKMYTPRELKEVLPQCDYIVITVPLTQETNKLIGKNEFILMKDSAFLINIGRGEVIDEEALIHALNNKEIAGAGLDVFENEPLDKNSPLWTMENVIVTPHTSGSTQHYTKRVIENIFLPNLKKYINENNELINLVNYKKGY
ncbi:D-2-hydroxyacid dehydrogenase [Sutcliffiella rhizosphaerae]|uniref:Glyoxylate/hydroxypyruvate reductase B n=1 Tax=Sutcliffiella rhizosphaerae TaxID=2880967 RepID=A0ABM8YL21_9BACI|nr:D-2-hydroxyacid dehydrogenase [Sutcliffiella rhizosphaerae]CAG9620656.1 Glyoxylate/hydroxypyruvate reductase B [Sutcliffiella rhizosphaerae]